jgi:hypothetical protein
LLGTLVRRHLFKFFSRGASISQNVGVEIRFSEEDFLAGRFEVSYLVLAGELVKMALGDVKVGCAFVNV